MERGLWMLSLISYSVVSFREIIFSVSVKRRSCYGNKDSFPCTYGHISQQNWKNPNLSFNQSVLFRFKCSCSLHLSVFVMFCEAHHIASFCMKCTTVRAALLKVPGAKLSKHYSSFCKYLRSEYKNLKAMTATDRCLKMEEGWTRWMIFFFPASVWWDTTAAGPVSSLECKN